MPRSQLTQQAVDKAATSTGQSKLDLFDTELPGLLLKVLPSGTKRYYTRHRGDHGRMVERKLADARIVSLRDAREMARERLTQPAQAEIQESVPAVMPGCPTSVSTICAIVSPRSSSIPAIPCTRRIKLRPQHRPQRRAGHRRRSTSPLWLQAVEER
ncbi:Arm DNA-binding domain-containing protein [Halorhodospira halochloris]|uniref:Arm DNA-binding domain-containing protein n=1 Tax=Halorhodospira halochloris TaxID=1052 RepID=UPI003B75C271